MKFLASSFLLMVSITFCAAQNKTTPATSRIEKIINSNWTFNYFPSESAAKGYESSSYDDSRWIVISIPHTWNTYETTGELNTGMDSPSENKTYWRNGWGWYRKHFSITQPYSGRKVFIEFEGVQRYCKVWVNGIYLGDHDGGYGSFDFDITPHLKKPGDNVIAVAVNNRITDNSVNSSEESFDDYGGICRDVTLVLKNKIYIPMQGSASHEGGTFITTPELTAKSGIVRIQTWVKNDDSQTRDCTLQSTVTDASGKAVQVIKTTAQVKAGELYRFDQVTKPVKPPHLWSPQDPYIYKVVSELNDGKFIIDTYTSAFGFRWFKRDFSSNYIYLNDKKIILEGGAINHMIYPWFGNAIPGWITAMEYSYVAEKLKCNFVRSVPDKTLHEQSDKLGLIVDEEISGASNPGAPEVSEKQIREIIRRDRNHPGIIFWSISSEADMALLKKTALSEDTTRIISSGVIWNSGKMNSTFWQTVVPSGLEAGEPAKIILTTLRNDISAERGSVALILASITDSKGNTVQWTNKILRWSVSGPAKLAGPAVYEVTGNMQRSLMNVIRSTGETGSIKVKVLSAGLVSGSVEISAKPFQNDNSVVSEPVLKNDGRTGVERIVLQPTRLEEVPREIKNVDADVRLTATDRKTYANAFREYVKLNNSLVDTATVEFRKLASLAGYYLFNNGGRFAADDYNYNADHFNACRIIAGYIAATKLPQPFKDGLREYYAELIIAGGNEMNAGDEMNWLNWIPSGGTVVYFTDSPKTQAPKGTIYTSKNELTDIILAVYPEFNKLSEDGKVRAREFIDKMNPYVKVISENRNVDGKTISTTGMIAEKGKPVLIPLYKFIAE